MKTKTTLNTNIIRKIRRPFTSRRNGFLNNAQNISFRRNLVLSIIFLMFFFVSGKIHAQKEEKSWKTDTTRSGKQIRNAVNVCPGGIAFGIFSANYERLLKPNHGLVFRADYENIPKAYSDANIEAYGMAFILNYRYHIGGGLESFYAGAYARYRVYNGTGNQEGSIFDFSIPEVTVGLNVGRRWIWKSGFTLNLAFGYGYMESWRNIDTENPYNEAAVNVFEEQYDFMSPFYGEFSIGYAF
ncbi:MAG: DUF3575 domain-containing protein [Bacteroidetes bacterium]|nr:DUF3575 domain-containing protein [Bacteroidota bacterium]